MASTKELYGFIFTSKTRMGILETLKKKSPLLQSHIAKKIKKTQSDISKEIYKLEKAGLIECLTPEKGSYMAYIITRLGREVLNYSVN